jgi:hypothetical protein
MKIKIGKNWRLEMGESMSAWVTCYRYRLGRTEQRSELANKPSVAANVSSENSKH